MKLADKTVLITGGAHRIGKAISSLLAASGANIVIHYNSSSSAAEATAKELTASGARVITIQGDLSLPDGGAKLFDKAYELTNGNLDAIVNCASSYQKASLKSLSDGDIIEAMRIHLTAPLQLTRALASTTGDTAKSVVNITDARIGSIDKEHEGYMLAKQSLADLTRNLAIELAPKVSVNAVAPGAIIEEQGGSASDLSLWAKANPMQSHGSPEGVAECVKFLLESDFITGQTIFYDGGYHLRSTLWR